MLLSAGAASAPAAARLRGGPGQAFSEPLACGVPAAAGKMRKWRMWAP